MVAGTVHGMILVDSTNVELKLSGLIHTMTEVCFDDQGKSYPQICQRFDCLDLFD